MITSVGRGSNGRGWVSRRVETVLCVVAKACGAGFD